MDIVTYIETAQSVTCISSCYDGSHCLFGFKNLETCSLYKIDQFTFDIFRYIIDNDNSYYSPNEILYKTINNIKYYYLSYQDVSPFYGNQNAYISKLNIQLL